MPCMSSNDASPFSDMIYGLRRMIYLLRKYDIISVPFIREAYIICEADIIVKNLFCQVDKRGFLHGAEGGIRTLVWCYPQTDFESAPL